MDYEARSLPPEQAKALLAKVKEYRADLTSLKDQLKKAMAALPSGDAARAELVSWVAWRLKGGGGACSTPIDDAH